MIGFGDGSVGMRRGLAATLALGTGTAMWESGELTDVQYAEAVMLGNGIMGGRIGVAEGMARLMGLLMVDAVPREINGQPNGAH